MSLSLVSSSGRERVLLCFVLLLVLGAFVGPALPGAAFTGLHRLQRQRRTEALNQPLASDTRRQVRQCATLFFVGLIATCAGSVFYHLHPDALRLAADRAGMTVAFAGLIGMAVCERVSLRAGLSAAGFTLAAGLVAVAVWRVSGDLLPWALVQFGGMALVLALAVARPLPDAMGLRLAWVIACYGLAKAFEAGDDVVYEATRHLVSGHSLKHLAAALAALPVLQALRGCAQSTVRHNPIAVAVTA